ncbi:MAG: DUF177 domain-containing protein [Candidatus Auribacterota bacterium]|nr:DUF177 domain-containing protein [Candidatus Auribacterota bacterium]
MLINLKSLPPGGMTFRGALAPDIIDVDEPGVEFNLPIHYDFKVSLVKHTLLVRGWLEVEVRFTCSRCLREFSEKVEIEEFNLRKQIDDPAATIDLTEDVRADIILALPQKPLCRRDCAGLCPICGQDLNMEKCNCSPNRDDSPFRDLKI